MIEAPAKVNDAWAIDALEPRLLFATLQATLTPPATVNGAVDVVEFTVNYADDANVDPASLGVGDPNDPAYPTSPADLTVTGPDGFSTTAVYARPATPPATGPSVDATYRFAAPSGRFTSAANGTYTITQNANAVQNQSPAAFAAGDLGTFQVNVAAAAGGDFGTGFNTDFAAQAVAVQPNGKALVVGSETYTRLGIADIEEDPSGLVTVRRDVLRRFNADGTIDASFGGGDGRAVGPDGSDGVAYAVAVRPTDGAIYVAGGNGHPATNFTLTRYLANGMIDADFGNQGVVNVDFDLNSTGNDVAHAIAFQPDGKVVLAGHATVINTSGQPDTDFALTRLDANGSVDLTFGTAGLVTTDISGGQYDSVGGLAIAADGRIVVAGSAGNRAAVARYTPAGALDTTFNTTGFRVLTDLGVPVVNATTGEGDFNVGLAVTTTGDLLVASATTDGENFAVTKLAAADGATAPTFGTGGLATADFGGTDDADAIGLLPSGALFVVGTTRPGGSVSTAVAVFEADGTPDLDFGLDGVATLDVIPVSPVRATAAVARDAAGNLIVARVNSATATRLRRLAGDVEPPTAALTPVAHITAPGGTTVTLTVTYSDDVAVDVSDIADNAADTITVTGPGGAALAVSLVSVSADTDGTVRTATYAAAAPGGSWDAGDNGTYTVAIVGDRISDASDLNFVEPGTLGTFDVNVVPGVPTAAFTPVADVTQVSVDPRDFVVTYTDPDGSIDVSRIATSNIRIGRDPDQQLIVTGVTFTGGGSTVVATYRAALPRNVFTESDNGVYVVTVVAGQVGDDAGQFVAAGPIGSFTVAVPTPPPPTSIPAGTFGRVNGRQQTLTRSDADDTRVTFALTGGGVAQASLVNGRIQLSLSGTTASSSLVIRTRGGDGRYTIGDVMATGPLRSIAAAGVDVAGDVTVDGATGLRTITLASLTGTLSAAGAASLGLDVRGELAGDVTAAGFARLAARGSLAGTVSSAGPLRTLDVRGNLAGRVNAAALTKVTVRGNVTGVVRSAGPIGTVDVRGAASGNVSAAGAMTRVSVRGDLTGGLAAGQGIGALQVRGDVTGAQVLCGADLGADGQVGGSGADADAFGAGAIRTIAVTGEVNGGLFGAGLDPVNGQFLDGDDRVVGVAESVIRTVTVRGGVDDASRFVAGAFGRARVPGPVDLSNDIRFKVL